GAGAEAARPELRRPAAGAEPQEREGPLGPERPRTDYYARGVRRLGPAMEVRDFRLWWLSVLLMWVSLQMLEVSIGWEVYAQHGSALDLGWIGLAEFVPMFVLALPAGQLADRVPRRVVYGGALLIGAG